MGRWGDGAGADKYKKRYSWTRDTMKGQFMPAQITCAKYNSV